MFLKALLIGMMLYLTTSIVFAQDLPLEIPRLAQQRMSEEWYSNQIKLWENEIQKNPKSENAWFNYFKANRYFGMRHQSQEDMAKKNEKMQSILKKMEEKIPNSFVYHYCLWWNGGNNFDLINHLFEAYSINPNIAESVSDFVVYYEVNFNKLMKDIFLKKWYDSNLISSDLLYYSMNVLNSLEKNAVIFTNGDNDTFPLWMIQSVFGFRTDVSILNISLAFKDEYRAKFMKDNNIKGDASKLDPIRFKTLSYNEIVNDFMKNIAESNDERPIYFALTVDPELIKDLGSNLYLTGLANKYSEVKFDNIAELKKNWNSFKLDYLDINFYNENHPFTNSWLPSLHLNYLSPAIVLYNHYRNSNDYSKRIEFASIINKLAKIGNAEEEIKDVLFKEDLKIGSNNNSKINHKFELIELQKTDKNIEINPNTDKNYSVKLIGLDGKEVFAKDNNKGKFSYKIDNLKKGSYFVYISDSDNNFFNSFVIE